MEDKNKENGRKLLQNTLGNILVPEKSAGSFTFTPVLPCLNLDCLILFKALNNLAASKFRGYDFCFLEEAKKIVNAISSSQILHQHLSGFVFLCLMFYKTF